MTANELDSRVVVVHRCFSERGDSILSVFSWEPYGSMKIVYPRHRNIGGINLIWQSHQTNTANIVWRTT